MSSVQFNGDVSEVEAKYPSLTLWVDGDQKVYFEENGERSYLKNGDWVVLQGNKHVVQSTAPKEEKASKAKAEAPAPGNSKGPNDETTEMRPGQGSATTDDRV